MLQPLYLDVSKVDLVLHLSSSHIMLHRLFRSRQGIHMNQGWAMGTGRGHAGRSRCEQAARAVLRVAFFLGSAVGTHTPGWGWEWTVE